MQKNPALLIVDVQNDFCPQGALPVPAGDRIIPPLNRLIEGCRKAAIPIIATRDWHPPDHCSFQDQGGPWPPHCVQGTLGAMLHPDLRVDPGSDVIVSKGQDRSRDAYSGFEGTRLAILLRERSVQTLWVGGLATDYCVRATALDALREGCDVYVIADAIQGVEVNPGDCRKAVEEIRKAGAGETDLRELLTHINNFIHGS